jgi:hypothetical protein
MKSSYIFEIPKYSVESSFKKNIRKGVRSRLITLKCRNVIVGTPSPTKNIPSWAHHTENWQEFEVVSKNCIVIHKPAECDGTSISKWLFEDLKTERDWLVCRKPD